MQHVQEKSGPTQSAPANMEGTVRKVQQEKDKLLQEKEEHDDKQIQDFQLKSQVSDNQGEDRVSLQQEIQQLQQLTREKDHAIEVRERQLRELDQQLAASEQVTAHLQKSLLQREKMIRKLQEENQHLRHELGKALKRSLDKEKQTPSWKTCKPAPHQMSRGSATVCGHMAYFSPDDSRQVYSYNSEKEEWSTLPGCSTHNFTLTVVNGHVTAVGGRHNTLPYKLTNTLLSLMEVGGKKDWMEHFPRMPTRRELTAVVCSGKAVVVAGGRGEWRAKLSTVEVMDTDTLQWSTANRLPHPLYSASATVCGDTAYLVGGLGYSTKSVFTYSLDKIHPSWCTSTDVPVTDSTCVTLNGQLVAVGGRDSDGNYSNNIYSYNTRSNSWEVISHMPTPRSWCLVAVLPGNKLMVVGGETYTGDTHEVHITSVQ